MPRLLVGGSWFWSGVLLGRTSLPRAIARGACTARWPCRPPANVLRRCAKRGGAEAPLASLATAVAAKGRHFLSAGARCCDSPRGVFPLRASARRFAIPRGLSIVRRIPSLFYAAIAAVPYGQWLGRGLRPRIPLPAERARGRGVFHSIEKATNGHFLSKCPPATHKKT